MIKRLKRSTALCVIVSLFMVHANAQFSVGFQGGYAKNYLLTNISNLVSTQYNPLSGFSAGVPVVYEVNDWFSIKATPSYTQKNYQYARTGFYQGVYQNNTNGYIQLPVVGQFSFGSGALKGYVDAGAYAGFWLAGHVKGRMADILAQPAYTNSTSNAQPNNVFDEFTAYEYSEKDTFNNTKDNRIELGVVAGAGLSYELDDSHKLFAEATYYDGLTDLQKKYQTGLVPRYNQTYVFSVGILFTLGSGGGGLY